MKPLFGSDLELCFTDPGVCLCVCVCEKCEIFPDSLFYDIRRANIDTELARIHVLMDFSNYPHDHPLYSEENKMIPGRWETHRFNSTITTILLKYYSIMYYSICTSLCTSLCTTVLYILTKSTPRFKDEVPGKTITQFCGLRAKCYSFTTDQNRKFSCAGVKKAVAEKELRHEQFVETLITGKYQSVNQCTLRSRGHRIFLEKSNRIGLNAIDLKRIISDDGIHTVPYGFIG